MSGVSERSGELSALEARADVDSLEDLQQRRRALIQANAKLIALYGPFGHYDDHRKARVEAAKIAARMQLQGGDKKPTEAQIDAYAYGSEEYGQFLSMSLDEKILCLSVLNEITEIEEKIRSRELAIRAYCAEPK